MSLEEQRVKFNQFYDADSSLEEIRVLPEAIIVYISYEELGSGWELTFRCPTSIVQIGIWDEFILDHAELLEESELINQTRREVQERNRQSPSNGMGGCQFSAPWYHYKIVMIDGSSLNIVAQDVDVKTYEFSSSKTR